MRTLVLAEKPDQEKKYAYALGNPVWRDPVWEVEGKEEKLIIFSVVGHLFHLKNAFPNFENWKTERLPLFPSEFHYEMMPDKKQIFQLVKKEIQKADRIIVATDPDREGEAIAYRILERIPHALEKVEGRLWANSLSKSGIQMAFQNLLPARETVNFYHEANARNIADWLVGFNLSPFTTNGMKSEGILDWKDKAMSVGRVQTPIVYLVVKNDELISSFQPEIFYNLSLFI